MPVSGGVNPFRYTAPVGPGDLIDREAEAAHLADRAVEGNNSRVVAPRRYGKTSLVKKVMADLAREGWATVHVDFFGVLDLADVADRIEDAYAKQLDGTLAKWFSSVRRVLPRVRLDGGPVPVGVDVNLTGPDASLRQRLALPLRIHERDGTRVLVVFDEFSEVLSASGQVDAIIRSEIQHHGEAASYIFAGSSVGMMKQLFGDRRRAFYGQAGPVELPPLPPESLGEYVTARFDQTSKDVGTGLDPLLTASEGHPQRAMLLAHELWDATPAGGTARAEDFTVAYDRAQAEVQDELRAIWTGLTTVQRRVIAGVARQEGSLYSANAPGAGTRGGGTIRSALNALLASGDIVADPSQMTKHRLVDPMLAGWLRAGTPGA